MRRLYLTSIVFAVAIALLLPLTAIADSDASRINRERKEIGRALIEVQSYNWPAVLPYCTDDVEYQDPIVTIEGIGMMTEFLARLFVSTAVRQGCVAPSFISPLTGISVQGAEHVQRDARRKQSLAKEKSRLKSTMRCV